ncbi:MAG: DMT family transporter [Rickettsiales bacterium]
MKPNKHLPHQHNLMGICFMLLHVVGLSILYATAKFLTSELNSNLVVFLYKFTILIMVLPWCLSEGISGLKTKKIHIHITRAIFSTLGSLCMFYSLKYLPLADVTAITKMEQVVLLIIGILYFKEVATKTKMIVILLSFLGAMMIIRPDLFSFGRPVEFKGFNSYYLFVFLALLFWSINSTFVKVLGKTEKTKVQLFYVLLFSSFISFPVSFMHWYTHSTYMGIDFRYPTHLLEWESFGLRPDHMKYILLLGICYFSHVVGNFKAFKHAELSMVVPLDYLRLVLGGLFGYFIFSEQPLTVAIVGYCFIIAGGVTLVKYEHRKAVRRKKNDDSTSTLDQQ